MLIQNQWFEITITSTKFCDYYNKLGYNCSKFDKVLVRAEDLPKTSMIKVELKCDICHKNYRQPNRYYKETFDKQKTDIHIDACKECRHIKRKITTQTLYGVSHVMHLESTKDKLKQTSLERYGVENYTSTKECRDKIKNTCMKKYGVENYSLTQEYKEKVKNTCMERYGSTSYSSTQECREKVKNTCQEKYGTDSYTQTESFKEKTKNTIQKKYGCDYYAQTDEYREKFLNTMHCKYGENVSTPFQSEIVKTKIRQTNLKKYGVENPHQFELFKNKIKQTNLIRYGVENYSQTDEFKEKYKKTCLEKYGVEHSSKNIDVKEKTKQTNIERYGSPCVLQNKEIRAKISTTLLNNESVKTSSQQNAIYDLLKTKYDNIEKNYQCDNSFFDIALFVDDIKIDIEYDGWYWHQNKQHDRRRDEHFKTKGWKILRIRSGHKLPTEQQLLQAINNLIKTNRKFTEIILDDWKMTDKGGEESA